MFRRHAIVYLACQRRRAGGHILHVRAGKRARILDDQGLNIRLDIRKHSKSANGATSQHECIRGSSGEPILIRNQPVRPLLPDNALILGGRAQALALRRKVRSAGGTPVQQPVGTPALRLCGLRPSFPWSLLLLRHFHLLRDLVVLVLADEHVSSPDRTSRRRAGCR